MFRDSHFSRFREIFHPRFSRFRGIKNDQFSRNDDFHPLQRYKKKPKMQHFIILFKLH